MFIIKSFLFCWQFLFIRTILWWFNGWMLQWNVSLDVKLPTEYLRTMFAWITHFTGEHAFLLWCHGLMLYWNVSLHAKLRTERLRTIYAWVTYVSLHVFCLCFNGWMLQWNVYLHVKTSIETFRTIFQIKKLCFLSDEWNVNGESVPK